MAKDKSNENVIATNRRAKFDYAISDTYEAGLMLTGSEVKSLRAGKGNINEAYVKTMRGEVFLVGAHINRYENIGYAEHDETRTRKLLLHAKEIGKIEQAVDRNGMTIVPLKMYWKNGYAKLLIGVAQGKKNIDKRATIKEREWNISKQRLLKK